MIERAAWGPTATRRVSVWRNRRWRVTSWLVRLVAALSRARDSDSLPQPVGTPSPTSVGARREEQPRAADPRAQAATLYEQHARAVLGYLCARLPTLDDAEDAVAEVFLAALAECAAGQMPGIGWLLTVARRRAADFYRQRHATQALASTTAATLAMRADVADGPEGAALRAEAVREALVRVAALPDEQRDALALRFAAGLRAPQIAAILGKSDEATRALLSRALRRLRKELAQ